MPCIQVKNYKSTLAEDTTASLSCVLTLPPSSSRIWELDTIVHSKNMHDKTRKTPTVKQNHGHRKTDDGDKARAILKNEDLDRIKYQWRCDKKEMELKRNGRRHQHFLKDDSSSDDEDPVLVKKPKLAEHKRNFVASWLQSITFSPTPAESTSTTTCRGNKLQEINQTSSTTPTSFNGSGSILPASTKKVTFVLERNTEHDYNDYWSSVKTHPRLPFDTKKRPSFGLLKRDKRVQSSLRSGDGDLS